MDRKALIKRAIQKGGIDLAQKGFIRRHHGRQISIYHVAEDSIVFIDGEMSGVPQYDFLIFAEYRFLDYAYSPRQDTFRALALEEKQALQMALIDWLKKERIRHDIQAGE